MSEIPLKNYQSLHTFVDAENKMGRIVLVLRKEERGVLGTDVDPIHQLTQGSQHSCTCENLL